MKCLYQTRRGSGHVLVVSILPLSRFIYWILEMLRQCRICFHTTPTLIQRILRLFYWIFFSFDYSTIRYFHDSLIAKTYWPVITGSMCKIIPNKTGYEKFTTNMTFDVAIFNTKTHGTSNLQNIEDSSSKLEWNINYNY